MDATNSIATDLFYKIRSRFSGLKLGTAQGTITISPEQARFFDFDYMDGENPIGHVSISLAEENSMKVYFSTGITESMDDPQKYKWYGFLKELRQFAKRRLMAFDTRDIAKDNLDKRDFAFLAQYNKPQPQNDQQIVKPVGENIMSESTMYGTRTMSYQKLMDTRLIIKHSHALVDDQQPGARTRNISALFVENHDGERFKYPFIHLAGARAMQRHVANSGLPYDDVGKSIINMSEEIAQLKSFSNYVVRNDLMNSDTNDLIIRSQDRLNSLREQIAKIAKQKHYESYVESFEAQAPVEVPQEIVEQFKDQFTIKSFKENIASVFPILYKLSQETSLGYDDIVAETNINDQAEVIEESEFENRLDRFESWILGLGEASAIQSPDEDEQSQAAKNLQELVSQHFPAGVDGTNAIESLKGIIEDPELFKEIKNQAKEDPDGCVRPLVKSWLEDNAPEVLDQLDFGDMVDEPVDGQTSSEEEPQMAGDDPDERNKKDSEDDLPFDVDYKDGPPSAKDEFGNTIKHRARHLARKGMRQAMDVKEVAEFISSFYDRDSGTFPKGPEGVVVMVGKKFGEQAEQVARKFVERMAPHQEQGAEQMQELARIRELSGLQSPAQEQISNEGQIDWNSDDVKEVEAMYQKFYVKDTPEGKLLLGDDVGGYFYTDHNGGEREGHITFVYNMDTGKFLEFPEDYNDSYGYLSDREVKEFVKDVVREVEDKIGPDDGPKEPKHPQAKDYAEEDSVSESQDDIYTIPNPDMERDAETGREEPDQIEVKVEFSSYDDEFEIDKVIRVDTKEDITDKVSNDRQLYFNLVYDVQQREQGRERDYNESIRDDVTPELEAIKRLSGITQGLGL